VVLFFDYTLLTVSYPVLPAVPALSSLLGALPTVGQYHPGNYLGVLFILLTIVAVLWLTVRYVRWISTVYAVTSSRVILQRGILSRDFDEIPILQIRGIDVHQTIVDRLFHYGTIVISSEGGNRLTRLGNESWAGIPRPFELQQIIESATQRLAQNNSAAMAAPAPQAPVPPPPPVLEARRPGPS
jgi:uncharacterized membrane protein YdbT with pleckstrin-like domain